MPLRAPQPSAGATPSGQMSTCRPSFVRRPPISYIAAARQARVTNGRKYLGNAIDTRRKIMDGAENLFADVGFDAVSMRDVARRSRVLLGQITYHFGTKEALFEEVVARRAVELNRRRRESLRQLRGGTIEQILDAYLHPYLDLLNGEDVGWHSYSRLIAQIGQSMRWQKLSARYFSELGHFLIDRLIEAEPTLARPAAVHGYVYMVSVMFGVFAASGLIDIFSDGSLHSSDLGSTYDSMIKFCANGIRSLATVPKTDKAPSPRPKRRASKPRTRRARID